MEYILKKLQKSSILQKNSCRNTVINKEKRNYMKKMPFYLPIHQQKQGIKSIFFHKVSFSIVPEQFLITFQQKIDSKKKKISYSSTLLESAWNSHTEISRINQYLPNRNNQYIRTMSSRTIQRRKIYGKENRDIPSPHTIPLKWNPTHSRGNRQREAGQRIFVSVRASGP